MGIIELMQRALDKTNDPDAIFALDRGITEIERLRKALHAIGYGPPDEGETLGLLNNFVDLARAALTEKQ